jgi:Ni,Fe-hydrogenase III small subunit
MDAQLAPGRVEAGTVGAVSLALVFASFTKSYDIEQFKPTVFRAII